jgi:hypothetical protein
MADPFILGAQGLASSLKSAQNIGKDLGKIVEGQNADMESAVKDQHRQRLEAKAQEAARKQLAEHRAFEQYEKEKAHQREIQHLKKSAIAKYGPKAWDDIEQIKSKIEKERIEEENLINSDRRKVQDLFWWCLTAAALVTYFFRLYK